MKQLNWLFLNLVNRFSRVHWFDIPDDSTDSILGRLEWAYTILREFKFQVEAHTVRFWTVSAKSLAKFLFHQRLTFLSADYPSTST